MTSGPMMTCYRHPGVPTGIVCTRCGRPICPDCMVDAAVGFQCPECARAGARQMRQGVLPYGGYPSRDPRLTSYVLIGINALVWLLINVTGGARSAWVDRLSIVPRGVCLAADDSNSYYKGATQLACSAVHGVWVDGVATGGWWQVVTSVFIHQQILHLALNMFSLFILGPVLERVLGRARLLAVYGVSGLAGSAAVMWLTDADTSTLGASGALFGLMGALLLISYKLRGNVRQVLIVLGINIAFTVLNLGSLSWQGHLGGLVGGIVATWLVAWAPRKNRETVQWVGLAAAAVLCVALIAVRAVQLA